jgi:hypothetical protein
MIASVAGPPCSNHQEPTIDNEIQLISDGDGLAVIGNPTDVERFLVSEGLQSHSKDLGLRRLSPKLFRAGELVEAGSALAAGSGRWVQLTQESAAAINKHALMVNSTTGLKMGVVQANGGQIQKIVQFAHGPGAYLTNPAILAGAAGLMAQLAMQQAMREIKDYLAEIDEKVDDVLRAQKDAVFADMIGVDLVIEEAMTVRGDVGRVSEVTWSKVQGTSMTIARTQAYVLRQLDALAGKLERETNMADLAATSKDAESTVREWLAVLARCFQLQDGLAILEIDRVLDASPDELNQHRLGLKAARQNRLELIARSTEHLMARMDTAASRANTKVLLHPIASRSVVGSSNTVASGVIEFNTRLGIGRDRDSLAARRWVDAAGEARDKAIETGADGVDIAKRFGGEQLVRAKTVKNKLATVVAERALRMRRDDEDLDGKADSDG